MHGKNLDIEAADLADSLMMAAPGPVLMVFVSSSRVRLLPGYVDHARSCPAESGVQTGSQIYILIPSGNST